MLQRTSENRRSRKPMFRIVDAGCPRTSATSRASQNGMRGDHKMWWWCMKMRTVAWLESGGMARLPSLLFSTPRVAGRRSRIEAMVALAQSEMPIMPAAGGLLADRLHP